MPLPSTLALAVWYCLCLAYTGLLVFNAIASQTDCPLVPPLVTPGSSTPIELHWFVHVPHGERMETREVKVHLLALLRTASLIQGMTDAQICQLSPQSD
jgi:hypothetical protein